MKQPMKSSKFVITGLITLAISMILIVFGIYASLTENVPEIVQRIAIIMGYLGFAGLLATVVLFALGLGRFTQESMDKKSSPMSKILALVALLVLAYVAFIFS